MCIFVAVYCAVQGWDVHVRNQAALPGFPALEGLFVDCAQTSSVKMNLQTGTSYVTDTVLLQLASKSPRLEILDLSGTHVTPDGLFNLARALAACRPATAAAVRAAEAARSAAATLNGGVAPLQAALVAAAAMLTLPRGALHVKDLRLDGSSLACDDGLWAVGKCCSDTLEQLVVRNARSRLGDHGIRELSGCSRLAALDITGCSVTEAGARAVTG